MPQRGSSAGDPRCRRRPWYEQTENVVAHRRERRRGTTRHKPPFALRRLSGEPHGSPASRAECGANVSLPLVACRPGLRARRRSLLSTRSAWTHAAQRPAARVRWWIHNRGPCPPSPRPALVSRGPVSEYPVRVVFSLAPAKAERTLVRGADSAAQHGRLPQQPNTTHGSLALPPRQPGTNRHRRSTAALDTSRWASNCSTRPLSSRLRDDAGYWARLDRPKLPLEILFRVLARAACLAKKPKR
jgi:hypothetical protein